ncbi:MAG: hypothetical protein AVDCRST_MAG68-4449, partial [uncultured Gemmatimonadetes bacterium]
VSQGPAGSRAVVPHRRRLHGGGRPPGVRLPPGDGVVLRGEREHLLLLLLQQRPDRRGELRL